MQARPRERKGNQVQGERRKRSVSIDALSFCTCVSRVSVKRLPAMHYEYIGALEVTYGNALAAGGGFHRVTTTEGSAAEVTPQTYLWYKLTASVGRTSGSSMSGRLSPAPAARKQLSAGSSLSSSSAAANSSQGGSDGTEIARGITQLRIESEDWSPPLLSESDQLAERSNSSSSSSAQGSRRTSRVKENVPRWTRMDKPIDRQRGLFVWYQNVDWQGPPSPSSSTSISSANSTSSPLASSSSSVGGDTSGSSNYPLREIRVVRVVKDIPEGFEYLPDPIISSAGLNGST